MRPVVLGILLAAAIWPAAAPAFVVQERGGLESYANGITLGPDGNLWAVEQGVGKVVRMKPDGTILGHFAVGPDPTSIASGPGGRVWVSVTSADKLVWIDATSPAPTTHDVSTASASNCGPVAIEAGNDGRMYFSMPNDGSGIGGCTDASRIGYTRDDGTGGTAGFERGRAYDLQLHGGKLFVPDFQANVIRRLATNDALTQETTVAVTSGNPDGVTVDGAGRLWVTLFTTGKVAHFPAAQVGGAAVELAPDGGTLTLPFGIVTAADGRIYVTGRDSANLARVDPLTMRWTFYGVPGARPWQIVNGPDDDLWFTDIGSNRLLRFISGKPRAVTGGGQALAPTAASVTGKVDPRGNATTVVFDYGTTAAYGSTTGPIDVGAGVGTVDVQANLPNLSPSTTYHVRVRATNGEGTTNGGDVTFRTPAGVVDADGDRVSPPADCDDANPAINPAARDVPGDGINQDCRDGDAPYPRLSAAARLSWHVVGPKTRLKRVWVTRLEGGETARITCRGRGCPFKSRTFRRLKKGTRKFDRYFRRRTLRPGTRFRLQVTKPRTVGFVATLYVRNAREPRLVQRCLRPGSSRPVRCD